MATGTVSPPSQSTYYSSIIVDAMYRKPRFLEELHTIREEMSRQCDYDVDLFAEMVRSGRQPNYDAVRNGKRIRGLPVNPEEKNEGSPHTKSHE